MGVVNKSHLLLTNNTQLNGKVQQTSKLFFTFTLNSSIHYLTSEQLYDKTVNLFLNYFMKIGFIGTMSVELTQHYIPHIHAIGTCHVPVNSKNGNYYLYNKCKEYLGSKLGREYKIEQVQNERACEDYVVKDVDSTYELLQRPVRFDLVAPSKPIDIMEAFKRDEQRDLILKRLDRLEDMILDMKTRLDLDEAEDSLIESQYDNYIMDNMNI